LGIIELAIFLKDGKLMDIAPKRLTVTVQQTAAILGLSVPSVWTLLHDHRLESIALNRRRLILWASIEELVESRRGVPGDARRNGAVPALAQLSQLEARIGDFSGFGPENASLFRG
jgi:helix-turn-helix protein